MDKLQPKCLSLVAENLSLTATGRIKWDQHPVLLLERLTCCKSLYVGKMYLAETCLFVTSGPFSLFVYNRETSKILIQYSFSAHYGPWGAWPQYVSVNQQWRDTFRIPVDRKKAENVVTFKKTDSRFPHLCEPQNQIPWILPNNQCQRSSHSFSGTRYLSQTFSLLLPVDEKSDLTSLCLGFLTCRMGTVTLSLLGGSINSCSTMLLANTVEPTLVSFLSPRIQFIIKSNWLNLWDIFRSWPLLGTSTLPAWHATSHLVY